MRKTILTCSSESQNSNLNLIDTNNILKHPCYRC